MLAHFGATCRSDGTGTRLELVLCFLSLLGLLLRRGLFLLFLNYLRLLRLHQPFALFFFFLSLLRLDPLLLSLLLYRFLSSMPPLHVDAQLDGAQKAAPAIAERTFLFYHLRVNFRFLFRLCLAQLGFFY